MASTQRKRDRRVARLAGGDETGERGCDRYGEQAHPGGIHRLVARIEGSRSPVQLELRRNAYRVQVDFASRRTWLRIRGGTGLSRGSVQGGGQGRHLGRRRLPATFRGTRR